uniref:Chemokine interleukin-8-like domain-containing protein n=1 Tax=Amazona collaria TaxID=241587 RepID=A0A8B9F5R6_9PSIT
MKVSSSALLSLLLAALWTGNQGVSSRSSYSACCYKDMFIRQKIPALLIKSYQETPSHCSHKAVRVELRNGKKFCMEQDWFQQHQRQKQPTRTST